MGRVHLFEIEDQKWFPRFLRNYLTDFLQFLATKTDLYKGVVPIFLKALEKSKQKQIIDLASGSGGGLIKISEYIQAFDPEIKIILTDFYPNLIAFNQIAFKHPGFSFHGKPVDAMDVNPNLKGFRTQFLSFHHFRPEQARKILQNAVDSKQPIAIFETQERSFPSILSMVLSPVTVLLTTPFIQPLSFGRIFFTYIIPLVPLFVMWDGIVSSLRTYSVEEMNEMLTKLEDRDTFDWEVGKVKSGMAKVLYLIGIPKQSEI